MNEASLTNSRIEAAYRATTPKSAALFAEAKEVLPGGLVHDSRQMHPYPFYCERASGPLKWDVDGNEYVDYYGGHGALLLGHCHPDVMEAVRRQLERGTHFAACTELEVRWSRLIRELMPGAEKIRFTASGTEASHMAIRLARAHSGRRKIVRFIGHFHGWHDHVAFGVRSHLDGSPTPGVLEAVADAVVLVPPNALDELESVLAEDDDVAAVMIETIGVHTGSVPTPADVLERLRALTAKAGVLLIFDEVVTGFRVSPGGAQGLYGVTPDLTLLGKIVAGGFPGGAVAGRADILEWLDSDAAARSGREKITHQGTFNANPVSAAAGIAALEIVRDTDACARATATAGAIRAGLNQVLEDEGIPWAVYGDTSVFHIFTNPDGLALRPTQFDASALPPSAFAHDSRADMLAKLKLAMVVNGVDLQGWRGGIVSATHGEAEVERTIEAWRISLRALKDEGDL